MGFVVVVVVENEIAVYLNVPFSYLSNINSKYVMRFDYYDNLLKSMRIYIFFIRKRMRNINH